MDMNKRQRLLDATEPKEGAKETSARKLRLGTKKPYQFVDENGEERGGVRKAPQISGENMQFERVEGRTEWDCSQTSKPLFIRGSRELMTSIGERTLKIRKAVLNLSYSTMTSTRS